MIIYSRKKINTNTTVVSTKVEEKSTVVNEEVKPLDNAIIQRPKKKKNIPAPVIEEPVIEVVEEKVEDEDLSKWLEEHTED